ncbi:universal stress protein [Haloferacaceae archaeon DSL9]
MAYEQILVPTDGSRGTERAVENALYLAELTDATIHALYVIDQRYPSVSEWDVVVERLEAEGEAALEAIEMRARERGITVETHLRRGVPPEIILRFAEDREMDLIVMGTHGRTGFNRFVHAGSVTERVVRHAKCPVLTARLWKRRNE